MTIHCNGFERDGAHIIYLEYVCDQWPSASGIITTITTTCNANTQISFIQQSQLCSKWVLQIELNAIGKQKGLFIDEYYTNTKVTRDYGNSICGSKILKTFDSFKRKITSPCNEM